MNVNPVYPLEPLNPLQQFFLKVGFRSVRCTLQAFWSAFILGRCLMPCNADCRCRESALYYAGFSLDDDFVILLCRTSRILPHTTILPRNGAKTVALKLWSERIENPCWMKGLLRSSYLLFIWYLFQSGVANDCICKRGFSSRDSPSIRNFSRCLENLLSLMSWHCLVCWDCSWHRTENGINIWTSNLRMSDIDLIEMAARVAARTLLNHSMGFLQSPVDCTSIWCQWPPWFMELENTDVWYHRLLCMRW